MSLNVPANSHHSNLPCEYAKLMPELSLVLNHFKWNLGARYVPLPRINFNFFLHIHPHSILILVKEKANHTEPHITCHVQSIKKEI